MLKKITKKDHWTARNTELPEKQGNKGSKNTLLFSFGSTDIFWESNGGSNGHKHTIYSHGEVREACFPRVSNLFLHSFEHISNPLHAQKKSQKSLLHNRAIPSSPIHTTCPNQSNQLLTPTWFLLSGNQATIPIQPLLPVRGPCCCEAGCPRGPNEEEHEPTLESVLSPMLLGQL